MEHWQIYATGIGTAIIVIGAVWNMSNDCKKSIGRVYSRFDEYKQHLETTHVSREVHDIKYKQLEKLLDEIKVDVKTLVRKANGQS